MVYQLPLNEFDINVFPQDYRAARQRWLDELSRLSCWVKHDSFDCTGTGPQGEALVTDTAWIGSPSAGCLIVVIGGTHGIEGFTGSAVHIDLIRLLAAGAVSLRDDTAFLLIHALTPWGYAWLRRCDQEGVDLNRNFVDFSKPLPENTGYEELRPMLFQDDVEMRKAAFADFERRYGRIALEKAISSGQYRDSSGPFYGGNKPAHGRRVIEQLIQDYQLESRNLAVIDVHTGLGPYGYGEIICDHLPDSAGTRMAVKLHGPSVTLPLLGTSTSVPKLGLLDYAWHDIMNENSCYVTLEFGTFSTDQLFEVLLLDHRLWADDAASEPCRQHGRKMLRHFCPDEPSWRELVLFRARQVIVQTLAGC